MGELHGKSRRAGGGEALPGTHSTPPAAGATLLLFARAVAVSLARVRQDRSLALELRLWASFRGQTLARTVEGMMHYEQALRLRGAWEGLAGDALEDSIRLKFQYVVAAQQYGQHTRARDTKAADTEFLLRRFPNLRVAYLDKVSALSKVIPAPTYACKCDHATYPVPAEYTTRVII